MPGTELQALVPVLKNASYRYMRLRDVPHSYLSGFAYGGREDKRSIPMRRINCLRGGISRVTVSSIISSSPSIFARPDGPIQSPYPPVLTLSRSTRVPMDKPDNS